MEKFKTIYHSWKFIGARLLCRMRLAACRSGSVAPPRRAAPGFSPSRACVCICCILALSNLAASSTAQNSFKTMSGTLIMFETVRPGDYDVLEYLRTADRVVCRLLRRSSSNLQCRILLSTSFDRGFDVLRVGNVINIYLHQDFDSRPDKPKLAGQLIRALLLTHSDIAPEGILDRVPDWLATGIYGKLESRREEQSIFPVSGYPGLAALTLADKLPPFRDSLNIALTPEEDGCAYELYRELCRFTLEQMFALSSATDNAIADIVILAGSGKYREDEIFASTAGRLILADYDNRLIRLYEDVPNDQGKIERWFRHQTSHRVINVFNPLPGRMIHEQFGRFRRVSYQLKGSDDRHALQCDILELPRLFDRIESGRMLLTAKSGELTRFINTASMIIATPLAELNTVLLQIGNEPAPLVSRRLERAVAEVENAIRRQTAIESYLAETEVATLPPGLRYRREIGEVRRTDDVDWPSMKTFLDEVEKSFLND